MGNDNIDLVVPYVDCDDPNWKVLFNQHNPDKEHSKEETNGVNRFRGQGQVFRYWFRAIERNMPWINKIHLVVQSESQVPRWIDKNKVHVVTHEQIIPQEFLPTFNSTTIEMFLWKIPGLAEKFIYSNDDFFAFKPMSPSDFFDGNKVRDNSRPMKCGSGMYTSHCLNCYCLVYDIDRDEYIKKNRQLPSFRHLMRPYLKSSMSECYHKYEKQILQGISMFRENRNHNIYLFDYYNIKTQRQTVSLLTSRCINSFVSGSLIKDMMRHSVTHFLCIQDNDISSTNNIYQNIYVTNSFASLYPAKSKYEV